MKMVPRGIFGWSPPHIQPLTPVSEVSEPPESPSPFMDMNGSDAVPVEEEDTEEEVEEIEPPPAAVPFSRLFACADRFDWVLMTVGSLAAAAHGIALVVYLHFFGKVIHLLSRPEMLTSHQQMFDEFKKVPSSFFFFFRFFHFLVLISILCWMKLRDRFIKLEKV